MEGLSGFFGFAMDLLKNGLEFLESRRRAFMATLVTYRVGAESVDVYATFGKTDFEISDESGFKVGGHLTDFIISTSELQIGGSPVEPKPGDQIVTDHGIYEVMYLGDACWRYCDPHELSMRIHTKRIT